MRKLQVKDVLTRIKEPIELEDDMLYKRVTIKTKHQGVFLRDSQYGKDIGTKKQFLINKGQFLLSKIDARNGAFGIVPDEVDGAIITGNFWTYGVNEKELNIELFYIMTSLPFFDELCKNASSGSTNRQYLDEKKFLNQEITLPSIEEQNSFIEHFKKLQEKHSQTLEELQTQTELINKLRSSILSDAVSGKLVPQDPNDESAEVLLEKIKAEKEKLTKAGKIKKQKPLPPISEDEIPYELPNGWVWCRLDDIVDVRGGKRLPAGKKLISNPTEHIYVRVTDMQNGTILDNDLQYISDDIYEKIKQYYIEKNDVYLVIVGSTIGKVGLVPELFDKANLTENAVKLTPHLIKKEFLYLALRTSVIQSQFFDKTYQLGQPKLAINRIKSTLYPLPPLEEQKRIVEKVERLMATCDVLELEVQNSKTETEKLMQSVLKEAFL
ncbi:MAG: restriction endonuclease subunit S [Campylobacterales bacterium]|nr:restriction endonuclease subunit S [Campylobacterales bacterium]